MENSSSKEHRQMRSRQQSDHRGHSPDRRWSHIVPRDIFGHRRQFTQQLEDRGNSAVRTIVQCCVSELHPASRLSGSCMQSVFEIGGFSGMFFIVEMCDQSQWFVSLEILRSLLSWREFLSSTKTRTIYFWKFGTSSQEHNSTTTWADGLQDCLLCDD